ncbi:hypothetical protein FE005_08775 [Enterococcus sp. M190262]|nr:hypothetical protein FE005_08775 [Enterococcus sp. M190262]
MRFKRIFTAIIYTSIVLITRASLTGFTDGVKSFFFTVSFFLFLSSIGYLLPDFPATHIIRERQSL